MLRRSPSELDRQYYESEALLLDGRADVAERLLWRTLRTSPRAAQSVMLLGISLLCQRKFEEAERAIAKAYQIKPWVRDEFSHIAEVYDCARAAHQEIPNWNWPSYFLRKDYYRSIGLDVERAVEHLNESSSDFFFIQVGANDGRSDDPISKVVRRHSLKGVLVEPLPEPFEKLKANYEGTAGLEFVNAAITEKDGPVEMFIDRSSSDTLATLVPERNALRGRQKEMARIEVRGLSFRSLLREKKIESACLIQIDTEGFDYHVLKSVPLRDLGTKIVNMEFYCLPIDERLKTFDLLEEAGMAYFYNGMDLLAVDRLSYSEEFCISEASEARI